MTVQYVVLSDLDGTLLDHHTYDWTPAREALNRLKRLNIPVVLNTSKTFSEVETLSTEIGLNDQPYIIENGSALVLKGFFKHFIPQLSEFPQFKHIQQLPAWVIGKSINDVHGFLNTCQSEKHLQIKSYRDWTVEEVAGITGLSLAKAQASKEKYFSEPFIYEGDEQSFHQFEQYASESGFNILKGGRFYHLQGMVNKASIMDFLNEFKALFWPEASELRFIALGDGDNDKEMLAAADYAIAIKSPVNDFPKFTHSHPVYSKEFGPVGWNEEMNTLLNQLNL